MNLIGKLQPVIIITAALFGLLLGAVTPLGEVSSSLIEVFLMLLLYILFLSIDLKKITIGQLTGAASDKQLIGRIFHGTKYKVVYEPNMEDYLLCHAAFVMPAAFACY